ncbi:MULTISPECIES: hypothetical protein [unclassified Comamonas]|uniref:hypothetical protein n=1 Tax=unclassified Comamonas TaxID=2638500 RepID=UPI001EFA5A73|nr:MULTISPECIES: hypothetical protein [unclassified Comamonas]ULR91356.1 hypothetical protein MJ205_11180 [Comamonas sp. B21-038]
MAKAGAIKPSAKIIFLALWLPRCTAIEREIIGVPTSDVNGTDQAKRKPWYALGNIIRTRRVNAFFVVVSPQSLGI